MNSFLTKKKDTRSFEEKISSEPEPTQRNKLYAINLFEELIAEKYPDKTIQDIVEELERIRRNGISSHTRKHCMEYYKISSIGTKPNRGETIQSK